MMPNRIQRRRTRGWKMPENAVYIGRGTKFGNPYRMETIMRLPRFLNDREAATKHAVQLYDSLLKHALRRHFMMGRDDSGPNWTQEDYELAIEVWRNIESLRGKDLACWCREGEICHGDVLIKYANSAGTPSAR